MQKGCRQHREMEMPRITKALPLPHPFLPDKKNKFYRVGVFCKKNSSKDTQTIKISVTLNISNNDEYKRGRWAREASHTQQGPEMRGWEGGE